MKCEKCGAEMLEYNEGHSCGYTCSKCGWGLATSHFKPYETDQTEYTIIIFGNKATKTNIKFVAECANMNYIQAKKLIEMPESVVLSGKALEIIEKRNALIANNISFKITPDFPY